MKTQNKMYLITLSNKNRNGHVIMVIAKNQVAALKMYDENARIEDWSCTVQSVVNEYSEGVISEFKN